MNGSNRRSRRRPRVALLIETSNAYARGLLRGVMTYVREHRPWSLYHGEFRRGDVVPDWLRGWDGQGVIARIENRATAEAVAQSGLPAVDVSAARLVPDLPCVETDDAAIGRLAADHLLERGFENFGFLGDEWFNWSKLRHAAFAEAVTCAGRSCNSHQPQAPIGTPGRWELSPEAIGRWVHDLRKPVGIMAAWDGFGQQLLEVCRQHDIAVPDEVAVLGCDNDEVVCELSEPPLTSVATDPRRTGYEAAALLDRMMAGEAVGPGLHVIRPLGIVTRQSTDVLAINDREVSEAIRFIREHACDGIGVDDVLEAVPMSRRVLEGRFRKLLDRSPHQEILRVQLQRVKQLLTETSLTLSVIAERTGFKHMEYLSVVFKRLEGMPPGEYRRYYVREPAAAAAGTPRKAAAIRPYRQPRGNFIDG